MVATEETAEFADNVSSSMIPTLNQHNHSSYVGTETIGNEEVESNSNDFINVDLESNDNNNNRPIQESNENQNALMSNSGFVPARGEGPCLAPPDYSPPQSHFPAQHYPYQDSETYQVLPPGYQELSPTTLPHLLNCPAATSPNIHWKWVGNGWSPTLTLPGLECQTGYTRRGLSARNRKVELVLWVFIIFLLIVIGLLSYSHLQLLNSIAGGRSNNDYKSNLSPISPHRPGSSPVQLTMLSK